MPITAINATTIYTTVQNQNTSSEKPLAREANSESGPAVTTTISEEALETARAVESAQRSIEQDRLSQEIAEERAVESQLARNRLVEDRQEQDRRIQDAIDLKV